MGKTKAFTVHVVTDNWDDVMITTCAPDAQFAAQFGAEEVALDLASDDDDTSLEAMLNSFRLVRVWEGTHKSIPDLLPDFQTGVEPIPPMPGTVLDVEGMACEIVETPPTIFPKAAVTIFSIPARCNDREKLLGILNGRSGGIMSPQPFGRVLVY